jgi:RHS repeat-associated protein
LDNPSDLSGGSGGGNRGGGGGSGGGGGGHGQDIGGIHCMAIGCEDNPPPSEGGGGCTAGGACRIAGAGGGGASLGSLDIRVDLGSGGLLKTGYLQLLRDKIDAAAFGTPALRFVRGPAEADVVYDPFETDPMRLRQIMAGECLADIVPGAVQDFAINLYRPSDVLSEFDANGLYQTAANALPFARYIVENPSGDTNDCGTLRHVTLRGGEAATNLYACSEAGDTVTWTLTSGGGGRVETLASQTNGVYRQETRTVADGQGRISARTRTTYRTFPAFGERTVETVADPGGANLVTSNFWYQAGDSGFDGPPGLLRLKTNSNGDWTRYHYDRYGRCTNELSAWLGSAPDSPASLCRSVAYNYAFLDPNLDTGVVQPQQPRTVTESILGQFVSRRNLLAYLNAGGERVEIEEQAAHPDAVFGDPANPRTVSTYFASDSGDDSADRIRKRVNPDGTMVSYDYALGDFEDNADPALCSFTTNSLGSCHLSTITYGTTDNPGGIAGRTWRSRVVRDDAGRILLSQEDLLTASGFERIFWTVKRYDADGRIVSTHVPNGLSSEQTWGCCGREWAQNAHGTEFSFTYDALKRLESQTTVGHGTQPDLYTLYTYDAVGRTLAVTRSGGGLSQTTTNAYDLAGRLVWSRGPDGIETFYSYSSNSTSTVRGGLTNLSVRFADGRARYTEQNGIRQQTYVYGVDPDGMQWTSVFTGPAGADSPAWSKTVTDPLGRTIAELRPGFGDTLLVTSNFYDTANHIVRTESSSAEGVYAATLFTYDSLGAPTLTAQDLDLDGQIDFSGPDRVSGRSSRYVQLAGDWHQESASWTYPESGSDAAFTNAIARTRLTGLGDAYSADGVSGFLASESVAIDTRGNATTSRTVIDRDNKTVYKVTDTPDSTVAALTVTVNGKVQSSRSTHDLTTTYAHDALGRQVAVQDARGAVRYRGYDDLGRVAWESDPGTNGIWYAYDSLGRRVAVTNALGQVTHTGYDPEGRVIATWGATYPVAYEYDAHGRMTAMRTFRDEKDMGDETQWIFDEATGLLTNKVYADGKGTAYTYTSDGKLASRLWARGVATSYAYTNGSSLVSIDYSDDTPDVSFQYDRIGRQVSAVVDGVSTNAFTYDGLDLVSETQNGAVLTRGNDGLGRPAGFSLDESYAVAYSYGMFGRFHSVSSSVQSVSSVVEYSRLTNTDLISGMTASSGFLWTRAYESGRSLITSVENRHNDIVISRYDYQNDALGRRVSRADSGLAFAVQPTYGDPATVEMPAYNAYSYNTRSEVTGATRRWDTPSASGDLVLGQQYAYEFDAIGNRIMSAAGDTDRTASYTANALNQYTQRSVPDEKDLIGTAPTNVAVTVNQNPVSRQSAYWHHSLEVTNAESAAYPQVAINAVYNPPGTNAPDVVTSQTGRVFVAETPEAFTYDNDGNLTQDGRFDYTWNGENRLIKAETRDDLPAAVPRFRVEYAYDHQGRMVWKQVSTNAVALSTRLLLWDGFNIVRETICNQQFSITNSYVWGLDLSGSLQGAGGVGGLLAEVKGGVPYFAAFDANGNVTDYLSADGALAAHYEYSPFGEIGVQSGDLADSFTHRFSTKPWCNVTGLSEYLFRKYSPGMGRWLSMDPIGAAGGINIYALVSNQAVSAIDILGHLECPVTEFTKVADSEFEPFDDGSLPAAVARTVWSAPFKGRLCNLFKWGWEIYYPKGKQATCTSTIRYRNGHEPTDPGGGHTTPIRAHEERHVDEGRRTATAFDAEVRAMSGCVCKPCFDARWDYLLKLEDHFRILQAYNNAQFDCDDFKTPIQNGNPRDQRCKEAASWKKKADDQKADLAKLEATVNAKCP